jgi:phosphatidylglycerol:prolipoprotein diacylglycerol transferase
MPGMLSSPMAVLSLKLLFSVLALAVGARLVMTNAALSSESGVRGLAGVLAGLFLGAKFGYLLQYPGVFLADGAGWFLPFSGHSLPGAVIGGWIGLRLVAGSGERAFADALIPGAIAILFIYQLGATFWSLTEPGFGAPALVWGIDFGDGVKRHPVALYGALILLPLLWCARWLSSWKLADGIAASVLGCTWFGASMLLGFLQPPFGAVLLLEQIHPRPALYPPGLSGEQWLCLLGVLVLAVRVWRAQRAALSRNP